MGLNIKKVKGGNGGKKHPPIDAGTYPARLVQVIDLGLQPQPAFQGQDKPPSYEVMLTYEFVDEFLKDENGKDDMAKPRWYSESIPLKNKDADLAKSTKRYLALDPMVEHDYDFTALVNTPCMVTIVQKPRKGEPDNPYVNIASVSSMRPKEAAKCPALVNPAKVFDLDNPDVEIFHSFPEWVQEKIKKNLEYAGSRLERALGAGNVNKPEPEEPDDGEQGEDNGNEDW